MRVQKAEVSHKKLGLWIDGQSALPLTTRYSEVRNPASGRVVRLVPMCEAADVERALQSALQAFEIWSETTPLKRARIFHKYLTLLEKDRPVLARIASEEHGKTIPDAMGSVQRGIEVVEFACGIPHLIKGEFSDNVGTGVDCYSFRQPMGVCAGITPFNFPAMVPMWMFPVAIACGNSFILKPSEKVPSCSMRLAELFAEAGLPNGVLNVIHGGRDVVDSLLSHLEVKAVSFVGSTPVARHVYEISARNGKRVQALGGAKNHAVVLEDADLNFAADAITGAAFGSAGERCMAISVVVSVGRIGDSLVSKLAERAARIRVGPGDQEGVEMGALITEEHRARVSGFIERGRQQGAKLVLDGREADSHGQGSGYFLGPTLFDSATPEMEIYEEEIFGPVLTVVRVETLDDAIRLVNGHPYGNGAALFTSSGHSARRFEQAVRIGMVGINVPIPVPVASYSFGGWKQSLYGDVHVHGMEGIRFYTRQKVVTKRWPALVESRQSDGLVMPTLA